MKELKHLTPFKYFALTNFPYIEADFDALTNYELYSKICEYINTIASSQNDTVDNFNELYSTWLETKEYIDTYFENLDVSSEINAKLDEMAESGELTDLMYPFFSEAISQVPTQVTNWLNDNVHPSEEYVITTSLVAEGTASDSMAVGDRIFNDENNIEIKHIYTAHIEDGYYNPSGAKAPNSGGSTYVRTINKLPCEGGVFLYTTNDYAINGSCYDKEGTFIKRISIKPKAQVTLREITPDATASITFYDNHGETYFEVYKVPKVDFVTNPYDEKGYFYYENTWIKSNGVFQTVDNLDCIALPNVKAGERYFVSNNSAVQCMCYTANNTLTSVASSEDRGNAGKIYTIPENAICAYFNIYHNHVDNNTDANIIEYISRIRKEKILVIGDSITWLDGHSGYGDTTYLAGYQKQLRLAGYDVVSAGFNGLPYTDDLIIEGGVSQSIYAGIVTSAFDVSAYKKIILFGGLNDVRLTAPLGDRVSNYQAVLFDNDTFNGAISGIIDYIRTNNDDVEIYIADFPKSEADSRPFTKSINYINEIEYNSVFWSCKHIDIFRNMNVQPFSDSFEAHFYDNTHPNYYGMQKIGKLIEAEL